MFDDSEESSTFSEENYVDTLMIQIKGDSSEYSIKC